MKTNATTAGPLGPRHAGFALWCAWIAVCGLLGGCGEDPSASGAEDIQSDADPEPTDQTPDADTVLIPEQIPWRLHGVFQVDDEGQSEVVEVSFPAAQRYVAVRVIPDSGDSGVCSRLEDVSLDSGLVLVGAAETQAPQAVCTNCNAPVSLANNGSVFVLGQGPNPLIAAQGGVLRFRVLFRDCSLGVKATRTRFPTLSEQVRVDVAWEEAASGPFVLDVRMAYGAASGSEPTAQDPHMAEVWRVAAERFTAAGIELRLEAEARLDAEDTLITYGPSETQTLDALQAQARANLSVSAGDARFVPVLWVGCLRQDDPITGERNYPLAQTTRIPGSLSDEITPSLVLIATGGCDPTAEPVRDAEFEGLVLAHELGHYLGLYHADTPAGAPLPASDDQQLMRSGFAQTITPLQAWFSPAQAAAMQQHPDLYHAETR